MKLSYKISLSLLFITLLSVGVLATFVYNTTKNSIEEAIGARQLDSAKTSMELIDTFMHERQHDILLMSRDNIFEHITSIEEDVSQQDHFMNDLSLAAQRVVEIQEDDNWVNIYIFDAEGNLVISSDTDAPQDLSAAPHVHEAFEGADNHGSYYTDVFQSDFFTEPVMLFSRKIQSSEAEKTQESGIVIAALEWQRVLEILANQPEEYIYLYNKQGYFLGGGEDINNYEDILELNQRENLAVSHALQGKKMSMVIPGTHHDGLSLISHVTESGYEDYNGNGWVLIVENPLSEVFAYARESARTITLLGIPLILLIIVILMFLLRYLILLPIHKLSEGIKSYAQGDLTARIKISRNDEFGKLADNLNKMANELQKNRRDIEEKVQERTAELEKINRYMTGRELKMAELKAQIKELKQKNK